MDYAMIMEFLKPLGAVAVSDTLLWINWAWSNDNQFTSYEVKILLKRILLYGGVAVSMIAFGASQEAAITAAGIGPMAEFLMTSRSQEGKVVSG